MTDTQRAQTIETLSETVRLRLAELATYGLIRSPKLAGEYQQVLLELTREYPQTQGRSNGRDH